MSGESIPRNAGNNLIFDLFFRHILSDESKVGNITRKNFDIYP